MDLYSEIIKQNPNALSKAITLAESNLESDQIVSQNLISKFEKNNNSIRIGVTGIPGVGKSTFIEKFGQTFLDQKKKVAILAIDPSSEKSQGSILGDKSRMNELSANKNVFIRPSSNSGDLGGVANKTKDCILLCEAAGFDIIIIETVGVGQSETTVSKLVDIMLLLTITGAGDQLQGIKRGIIELAHLIIVTKDDGDNKIKAKEAVLEFKNTTSINTPIDDYWIPKVVKCSALENIGIIEINELTNQFVSNAKSDDYFGNKRINQEKFWIRKIIKEEIGNRKFKLLVSENRLYKIEKEVINYKKNIYQIIKSL
jgi:LAO/AO transport system kinase